MVPVFSENLALGHACRSTSSGSLFEIADFRNRTRDTYLAIRPAQAREKLIAVLGIGEVDNRFSGEWMVAP